MNLHVPYTCVREATQIVLRSYPGAMLHYMDGEGAYLAYWKQRWAEGSTFINLEHDVVPWPGAIEQINACPEDWCSFGYGPDWDLFTGTAPFGLAKFTDRFIAEFPEVWIAYDKGWGLNWRGCDAHFTGYMKTRSIFPHQHRPAVLNANPKFLS